MRTSIELAAIAICVWIGGAFGSQAEELVVAKDEMENGILISYVDSGIHSDWDLNDEDVREHEVSPLVALSAAKEFVEKNLSEVSSSAGRMELIGRSLKGEVYWYWRFMFYEKITVGKTPRTTWIRVSRDGKVMARFIPSTGRRRK